MIQKGKIEELAGNFLEGKTIFPVEIRVQAGNRISVFIDGDEPVTIDECKELSQFLESRLDRDQEDFELTVSTSGADRPLILPRQFPKHIGRQVSVKTNDGETLEGTLKNAGKEGIEIEIHSKGKKKEQTTVVRSLPFSGIASVKVILSFDKK